MYGVMTAIIWCRAVSETSRLIDRKIIEAYAVPEPVGRSGESDAAGADGQWEDLANHDPCTRSPGRGEEEDVDADEGDHGGQRRRRVGHGAGDGHDELADHHTQGSPNQKSASTEPLDGPEGDGGRAHVHEGGDERDQEWVLDGSQRLKEGGSEVEDKVYTCFHA